MGSIEQRRGLSVVEGEPTTPRRLSVILPVFDEADNVGPLTERLVPVLDGLGFDYELLFVDDGSRDDSRARIRRFVEAESRHRLLVHRTNRGQSAALATGLAAASGDWVLTLDTDLQNPPEEIPHLLAGGFEHDIVFGRRRRRCDSLAKRVASRIGHAVRARVTGHRVRDTGCALKLMRRRAFERIPLFDGAHRFLPTLFAGYGFSGREVEVEHAPRHAGRSKYGLVDRGLRGLVDCLAVRWLLARAVDRSDG